MGLGKAGGGGIAGPLFSLSILNDSLRRRGECPCASRSASSVKRLEEELYDGCTGWYHMPGYGQAIPEASKIPVRLSQP